MGDYVLEDLWTSVASAAALRVPAVSEWSIAMHVHHCCLAMIETCQSLIASTPPPPRSGFSLKRSLVLFSGRIPRGPWRSPDIVVLREDVSPAELRTLLDQSDRILAEVHDLDPKTWFRHFAFGVLDRDKTLKLMSPHDLPPWQTVYYHHRKWRVNGVWEQVNRLLHRQARQQAGRQATPR